ncbi:hypothetical protein J1N35_037309 [Gossypium stocksii]|uniref:Uncharacterized protein n=1 Tax=Gossypium stocksii TaxID=47602 RepID=A0A9D3UJN8_9ROSI|nr:hypothetical protein J1N35_037309 [Gossypium stocksii]
MYDYGGGEPSDGYANGGVLASKLVLNRDVSSPFVVEALAWEEVYLEGGVPDYAVGTLEVDRRKMLLNDSRIMEEDGEIGENRDGKVRFLLGTATGGMTEMKDQESTMGDSLD